MYFLCQRAKQDVKVVLNGQGPDELFGGYKRHLGVRYGAPLGRPTAGACGQSCSGYRPAPTERNAEARSIARCTSRIGMRRYQEVLSLAPHTDIAGLFQDGVLPEHPAEPP